MSNKLERIDTRIGGEAFYQKYGRHKKISMFTLGCKVNQYETEAMKKLFEENGDCIVASGEIADVYVINTCTVTSVGDKKSRQFIRRAKRQNSDAFIVVVGCYSQIAPEEVLALEGVNLVLGTDARSNIVDYISMTSLDDKQSYVKDIMQTHDFEPLQVDKISDKTRVFLKIQEGCNQYCSYCIIPYARGNVRSRYPEHIYDEVKRLVAHGFKEFVLTGIHLASYGLDLLGTELIDIIENIAKIKGVERIRLGSLEPTLITEAFMSRLVNVNLFCPQFHLSLQSGCNTTLKAMNRRYTTEQYKDAVDLIRQSFDKPSITTDIIVGFPSETTDDFNHTYNFVTSIQFSEIHVFKFSKRKGTKAYLMQGQVAEDIKTKRSEALIELGRQMQDAYLKQFIGEQVNVLLERVSEDGAFGRGLTENHISVEVRGQQLLENTIVTCIVCDQVDFLLKGKQV